MAATSSAASRICHRDELFERLRVTLPSVLEQVAALEQRHGKNRVILSVVPRENGGWTFDAPLVESFLEEARKMPSPTSEFLNELNTYTKLFHFVQQNPSCTAVVFPFQHHLPFAIIRQAKDFTSVPDHHEWSERCVAPTLTLMDDVD